jgi:uncharacterized protein (DUF849 family)
MAQSRKVLITCAKSILAGGHQRLPLCTAGAAMRANLRIGLELRLEIARPAAARSTLALKGADQAAF